MSSRGQEEVSSFGVWLDGAIIVVVDEEEGTPSTEAVSPSGALRFFLEDSPGLDWMMISK